MTAPRRGPDRDSGSPELGHGPGVGGRADTGHDGVLSPVAELPPSAPELARGRRRYGRAGRDLLAAIGVGVGLAAVIIVSLLWAKVAFVVVVEVAVVVALSELRQALRGDGVRLPVPPLLLGAVAMVAAAYLWGAAALVVALALTVVGMALWRLGRSAEGYLRELSAGVLCAAYVPLLAGFAMLMLVPGDGGRRVLTFMLVTACSDIGGYAVGVLLGRHPMAPRISPKKSWEGFAGSVALCAVGGALCLVLLLGGGWWQGALLGVVAAGTATTGDLVESMIKRDLHIKDMSTLLPGHGGLMDRMDSLLLTAPAVWLLLTVFVPVP